MISTCKRCGHTIDTNNIDDQEQGITRAWVPAQDGEEHGHYVDYHPFCRGIELKERREQAAQAIREQQPKRGRPRAAAGAGAGPQDEM
ncbi:MAG TPA: hypothetical protein VN213_13555 [Solirubrobacteraceae bacterium]|nr:hypothetical protein [Solirubrobacteraceae bacterium]